VLTLLEWTGNDIHNRVTVPTDWVSYEKLRSHIAVEVTPGYALRCFNESRELTWRRRNGKSKTDSPPPRRRKLPTNEIIRRGQLSVATRVLGSKFFERSPESDGPDRKVRIVRVPRIHARDMPRQQPPPNATPFRVPTLLDEDEYAMAKRDLVVIEEEQVRLRQQIDEYEQHQVS
jgi:hypothetical protein